MERRSIFKALASLPLLSFLSPGTARAARPATVTRIRPEPQCESSLADAFEKIRAFVAERPASLGFDAGGTTVLSADNPETLTVGWSCFRLKSDGRGNLLLDKDGKKVEEAILVRVRMMDLRRDADEGRIHPAVLDLVKMTDGRRKLAAWLMSGKTVEELAAA